MVLTLRFYVGGTAQSRPCTQQDLLFMVGALQGDSGGSMQRNVQDDSQPPNPDEARGRENFRTEQSGE